MSATKTRGRSTEPRDFGMYAAVTASPLSWPAGWPRTPAGERKRAQFKREVSKPSFRNDGTNWTSKEEITVAVARSRLIAEFSAMTRAGQNWRVDPDQVVISSNLRVRADGLPYSDAREPDDPGVAVYFHLDGQPHCLPCDRWDKVAGNIAAIAAHVGAMRGMERWGVGSVAAAFAGFKALPPGSGAGGGGSIIVPSMSIDEAAKWLAGASKEPCTGRDLLDSIENVKLAYRAAAKLLHPDAGGDLAEFQKLQEVKRILDAHHGGGR